MACYSHARKQERDPSINKKGKVLLHQSNKFIWALGTIGKASLRRVLQKIYHVLLDLWRHAPETQKVQTQ